ncbi:hypothetical protein FKM82_021072 [Ascaphus truei]
MYLFGSCAFLFQVNAGWIGFWSIVGGCVLGIAVARFADSIRGILKPILVVLFSGATLSATWFTLTFLSNVTHLPLTTGKCLIGTLNLIQAGLFVIPH